MSDAARQAGLPLDQWLRDQLLGTTAAGTPPNADGLNNLAELRRRIEELAGQLGRIDPPAAPAFPEASAASASAQAATGWVEDPSRVSAAAPASAPARPSLASAGAAPRDDRLAAAIREIDRRLEALQLTRPRGTTPDSVPTPAAIEAAVAEIAARQSELDRDAATRHRAEPAPPSREAARPAPAVRAPLPREPITPEPSAARADAGPTPAFAAEPEVVAAPAVTPPPVHATLAALQGELAGMRQSLATLAPRRSVDELQRVVQQLAERVEQSQTRDEELRGALAALREMIGGLTLPEHPALLLGRIGALERKLDIVNAKVVDGATVARLQAQVSDIRELLARALSSDSVRLLAEQVSLLATKVSEMAANEDRAVRTVVGSLERRIDTLADRIGSQPAPVIPLDDLVSRLDAIQSGLASARRELPAGMESLIKGLSDRLERIERPIAQPVENPRLEALGRQIEDLTHTVEKAVSGAEVSRQLASIERAVNDLFIQMEETRATLLAPPRQRPPSGPSGPPDLAATRLRREVAQIETRLAADGASVDASFSARAEAAVATELAAELTAERAPPEAAAETPAPPPVLAPPPGVASFTPAPASIPKAFEPQLMRAALEALSRTSANRRNETEGGEPAPSDAPQPAPEQAIVAETEMAAADSAPTRAAFIAQARRAAQPSAGPAPEPARLSSAARADVQPPPPRGYLAGRHRAKPGRWLARVRAMLFIGLCGSALAYGSWHLLAQLRQEQLRAAGPASVPGPEDITGSIGKPAPRPPAYIGTPATPEAAPQPGTPAPAMIGPSSLSLPSDLPGGIANQSLRAAALGGDPAAAFEIARRFLNGEGVAPNPGRAAQWYAYAVDRGSVPAAYRLGALYEKGVDGVPRDLAKARALYERAANAGNVASMHNLGVMLASGDGGPSDYAGAARWFTRAAERGMRDSQYNLAVLYARGLGMPASPVEAWRWFALAAARGDSEAAVRRDQITPSLDAYTLAEARREVEHWTPLLADAHANDGPMAGATGGEPQQTASR